MFGECVLPRRLVGSLLLFAMRCATTCARVYGRAARPLLFFFQSQPSFLLLVPLCWVTLGESVFLEGCTVTATCECAPPFFFSCRPLLRPNRLGLLPWKSYSRPKKKDSRDQRARAEAKECACGEGCAQCLDGRGRELVRRKQRNSVAGQRCKFQADDFRSR